MLSIAFALALAAAPASASAPGADGCALLNPSACRDAGTLARDAAFRTALRQFVGERRTGYLTGAGQAYPEALAVLSGPAQPVRRLRNLYVFTACADASCDDQGSVALQPDGELAAVAILHSDCVGLRRVGDCAQREVLSILRRQDDDLGLIEALSAQARQDLSTRPITPGMPIKNLDRVEVIALDGPPAPAAPQIAAVRPAPQIAPPPAAAPKPAIQAAPPPPRLAAAPAPRIVIPAPTVDIPPPPAPVVQARQAPPPAPIPAPAPAPVVVARAEPPPPPQPPGEPPVLSEVTVDVAPARVELQPLPRPPERVPLYRPPKVILVMVRPRDMEPSPPPKPKPPRDGWQWHWTPADCSRAGSPDDDERLAKACKIWKR